jgi:hypothetical protein
MWTPPVHQEDRNQWIEGKGIPNFGVFDVNGVILTEFERFLHFD